METKKYELLKDDTVEAPEGTTLYRIRALRDIGEITKAGNLGGYVASEKSLSHEGNAWVSGDVRVYGNAQVSRNADILWFSHVGSEHGTLTCYRGKDGQILVTRGCFAGTDEEFMAAVEKKHGESRIGHEYRLLIEVARSRLNPQGE